MCVFCLLISLLINVVLVHPSQYTLAPQSTIGFYSTVYHIKAVKLLAACRLGYFPSIHKTLTLAHKTHLHTSLSN